MAFKVMHVFISSCLFVYALGLNDEDDATTSDEYFVFFVSVALDVVLLNTIMAMGIRVARTIRNPRLFTRPGGREGRGRQQCTIVRWFNRKFKHV